jgi:hypothetical protein
LDFLPLFRLGDFAFGELCVELGEWDLRFGADLRRRGDLDLRFGDVTAPPRRFEIKFSIIVIILYYNKMFFCNSVKKDDLI